MKIFLFFSILLQIVITNCLRESVAPNPTVLDVNMPGKICQIKRVVITVQGANDCIYFLDRCQTNSGNKWKLYFGNDDYYIVNFLYQNDHYLCTFLNVEAYGTQYIQSYTPNSDADRAHHMLLFTCDDLDKTVSGQDWW